MQQLEYLSAVALPQHMPEKGLVRGQICTLVEVYSPTVGEVKFCDTDGRTYALEAFSLDVLIRLQDRSIPGWPKPASASRLPSTAQ